jgi:hypothetical protein
MTWIKFLALPATAALIVSFSLPALLAGIYYAEPFPDDGMLSCVPYAFMAVSFAFWAPARRFLAPLFQDRIK